MKQQNGFTLIELMITVAIVAILAAVALPAYTDYVIRGKLPEAHSALANYRVQLEQYYQDNRNYGTAAGACGIAPAGFSGKYFDISCVVGATNQTYTASAKSKVGVGLGAADDYTFTINDTNTRNTTKFAGADSTAACWMTKRGDSC